MNDRLTLGGFDEMKKLDQMVDKVLSYRPGVKAVLDDIEEAFAEAAAAKNKECPICGLKRNLVIHHLIPENNRCGPTIRICEPCHRRVHKLFSNAELKAKYSTRESLLEAMKGRG